jgi:PAS domain-containing protein
LRDAVNHIDQGVTLFDAELRLVVWNRRYLELIGMPEDMVAVGLPLEALLRSYAEGTGYAQADVPAMVARRLALARTGLPNQFEHTSPDGTVLAVVDRPLPDGSLVSTYTDVTQKRFADMALRAAYENAERLVEKRTRDLSDFANLSSDWFWEQDAEFRFTRFFGNSTDKLRREPTDFLGKRRWDMPIKGVTPEQMARHIASHERHESFRNSNTRSLAPTVQPSTFLSAVAHGSMSMESSSATTASAATSPTCGGQLAIRERRGSLANRGREPIPTFVIDAQQRVTHWNKACIAHGHPAEEMLGQTDLWRAFLRYAAARDGQPLLTMPRTNPRQALPQFQTFHADRWSSAGRVLFPSMEAMRAGSTSRRFPRCRRKLTGVIETLQDITGRRRASNCLKTKPKRCSKPTWPWKSAWPSERLNCPASSIFSSN